MRYLELKPNDEKNKQRYGFLESPKLRKYFLDYLFYFLLLPYAPNKQPVVNPVSTGTPTLSNVQQIAATNPTPDIPACMSESIYKRYCVQIEILFNDSFQFLK